MSCHRICNNSPPRCAVTSRSRNQAQTVRVLGSTSTPKATNLVVRQHAISRRLLRGFLDAEHRIHVGQHEPLFGSKGIDARDERAVLDSRQRVRRP